MSRLEVARTRHRVPVTDLRRLVKPEIIERLEKARLTRVEGVEFLHAVPLVDDEDLAAAHGRPVVLTTVASCLGSDCLERCRPVLPHGLDRAWIAAKLDKHDNRHDSPRAELPVIPYAPTAPARRGLWSQVIAP